MFDDIVSLIQSKVDAANKLGYVKGLSDAAAPLMALEQTLHQNVSDAQAAVQALIDAGQPAPAPVTDPTVSPQPSMSA